ncbi:MAG TPA: class I adenylate-forming enzyme family protein [Myxococcota bacterium]|nr:class I adenylate-forming enzyme family protein [Myxococcota bacterium]
MRAARTGQVRARLTTWALLRHLADEHAARPALRFPDQGVEWTYADLAREARALARGLLAAGVAPDDPVGLLVGNRPEWVAAWLATGLVGAVAVPVNTMASGDEIDWILRHADVSTLLLQPALASHRYLDDLLVRHPALVSAEPGRIRCDGLPELRRAACLGLDAPRGGVVPWEDLVRSGADVSDERLDAVGAEVDSDDDALIIYTSGTTDRPKGIVHVQKTPWIQSTRFASLMGLTCDDRVFTSQPFFWTAGIAMSLGATLVAGARLVLQETFEPGRALELIERERITTVHAWPHQEKALGEHPDAARRDLRSVTKTRWSSPLAKLAGLEADRWGVDASYGLSETFTIVSALPADMPAEVRAKSSGKPLPGIELRIVDPLTGAPCATGEPGEIAVRGTTLMRGYHKVPRENAFDADGWFRTQDGGSLDADGHLHWTGRLSNLVKTGGANVSPLEIEGALRAYPGLRAALAVGVPHPTLGEALVLCAIADPAARPAPDGEAIRVFLRERLAAYKVPRRVLFFAPDEIAYTGNQKIQVGELRTTALARLAAEGAEILGHRYADA